MRKRINAMVAVSRIEELNRVESTHADGEPLSSPETFADPALLNSIVVARVFGENPTNAHASTFLPDLNRSKD
ncbi:hypothetical protein FJV41_00015 [Myxococcus llanfairpwllgwyngyllgogerychwyrndrobwllllantysiliogogogochensis]|uniref:Uncharacterized protein n=1 Tax=Myxococcus llanfairpwllgwyngyllgogerychwyrndrobwllllantysiliogogogochensis TaxID=2590453 RepID=A0A540X9P9_9BACT|nr:MULTISPECIES: hypothetical protein [Myxococcus]TQF17970.1 hypothetical protein FJV41_00015 [Myxococcus llanfairpwllgwyngyllgogerychwyrndrobwllllantysiliogogogochensis]